MAQSQPFTTKDLLLASVLNDCHATSIRSLKDLEANKIALLLYQYKETIKRRIFRTWCPTPSNPNDEVILEEDCIGKMTSNKNKVWGATLWDFYKITLAPSDPPLFTISLSELSKRITKHGRTGRAIEDISTSARNEEDPREIIPFPLSDIIEAQEMDIRLGVYGKPYMQAQDVSCPVSYPEPWPLTPFSYDPAPLEQHIPLYQLPDMLVVHDPWELLSASNVMRAYSTKAYDWTQSMDMHTYKYDHAMSARGEERKREEAEAKKEEKARRRLKVFEDLHIHDPEILSGDLDAMLLVPSFVIPGPSEPPVLVLYEAAPDPKPAEVAHLYLSPKRIIGEGNHSYVLDAEWEIPRSLVVPDILCYECILEDVHQTLLVSDGADGSRKDEKWKTKSGVWYERQVGHQAEVVNFPNVENPSPIKPAATYVLRPGDLETKYEYTGPFRPIKTNVKWQNGDSYCSHISKRLHVDPGTPAHPRIARVSVAAKLSLEGDGHLLRESKSYQDFPQHFFEHWNGYNIVSPLRWPTPVGAVAPHYYGYYTPRQDPDQNRYLSPIMLLEKCGCQVEVNDLSTDDKLECASLFFRLHKEGYVHLSPFPRNLLYQDGPLDRPRYQRGTGDFTDDGRKHSFRLIDFGRTSQKWDPSSYNGREELDSVHNMTGYRYLLTS